MVREWLLGICYLLIVLNMLSVRGLQPCSQSGHGHNVSDSYFNPQNIPALRRNNTVLPAMELFHIFPIIPGCNGFVTALHYCYDNTEMTEGGNERTFRFYSLQQNISHFTVTGAFRVYANSSKVCTTDYCCDMATVDCQLPVSDAFGVQVTYSDNLKLLEIHRNAMIPMRYQVNDHRNFDVNESISKSTLMSLPGRHLILRLGDNL